MAKKSAVEKQKRKQKMVALKQEKRAVLKKIVRSLEVTEDERMKAVEALNKMSASSSAVRLKNRCQLTGRPKGYYRKFKLSRLCFRELANSGMIPGIFKASW